MNHNVHALQTATRADLHGASEPTIFIALVHDLFKPVEPLRHGEVAAQCFRIPERHRQVLAHHGEFIAYSRGEIKEPIQHIRESWYELALDLGEWDAASYDTSFPSKPLGYFEPLLAEFL